MSFKQKSTFKTVSQENKKLNFEKKESKIFKNNSLDF